MARERLGTKKQPRCRRSGHHHARHSAVLILSGYRDGTDLKQSWTDPKVDLRDRDFGE